MSYFKINEILRELDPDTLPQDMRGMSFRYKILHDLEGKDLHGCVFYKCHPKLDNEDCIQTNVISDIVGFNQGLKFEGAWLVGVNLQGANLQWVNLQRANLHKADLRGADLRGADLRGATTTEADFEGALYDDMTRLYTYSKHTQVMRHISEIDLEGANLKGYELKWAKLKGANLQGANLEGVNLQHASLEGANLKGANLEGANLRDANLYGANLKGANLEGTDLHEANLYGANLEGANLKDAIYDDVSKEYFTEEQLSVMRHISEVDDE